MILEQFWRKLLIVVFDIHMLLVGQKVDYFFYHGFSAPPQKHPKTPLKRGAQKKCQKQKLSLDNFGGSCSMESSTYICSLWVKKWITFLPLFQCTPPQKKHPKNTPKKGSHKKVSKAKMIFGQFRRQLLIGVFDIRTLLVGQKVFFFTLRCNFSLIFQF